MKQEEKDLKQVACCENMEAIMNHTNCCSPNNDGDTSQVCCSPEEMEMMKQKMTDEGCCTSNEGQGNCDCYTSNIDCCRPVTKQKTNEEDTGSCCESDGDCGDDCCTEEAFEHGVIGIDANEDVTIEMDGQTIKVNDQSKNLVEIGKEAGISIPAPCFLAKRKHGCCKACLVQVDGKQTYACATKAKNTMKVVVNRPDLVELRRERLLAYKEKIK